MKCFSTTVLDKLDKYIGEAIASSANLSVTRRSILINPSELDIERVTPGRVDKFKELCAFMNILGEYEKDIDRFKVTIDLNTVTLTHKHIKEMKVC